MDRRNALKKMGLSLGYITATPTVINILQSCTNEPLISWIPQFFSKNEAIVVQNLIDLILPATENIPGAIDVNVPQFIDMYYYEVVERIDQDVFRKGIGHVIKVLSSDVEHINSSQYDDLLAKYLKANQKEQEAFKNNKEENLIYQTLLKLRSTSVWAFKTSQKIGQDVLAYDPVPGVQLGCTSLEEATGGKAWSLIN